MTRPTPLPALRRRTTGALVVGVALGSTGHIAAVTVATIVARSITGSAETAGAPAASVVLGAALGATLLSWLMSLRGRRLGLAIGYVVGVLGAAVAVAAVVWSSLPLLLVGTLLLGFGNASNQLSRYTAADLYPPERRASAIGLVVSAATVGAVVGPNLVGFSGPIAVGLGFPELAGPYLVPIVFVGAAALLSFGLLRPDPYALAYVAEDPAVDPGAAVSLRELLARPAVATSIVALVVGQFVMVLIMTMTPLHMTEHGHGLEVVGLVISAHTFGMYALSSVSGRLTDRFGSPAVIYLGTGVLAVSALLSAAAPADADVALFVALFLLGWGWNLGFVAGSALLTGGLSLTERTRIQGVADALIWSTAAVASLGSGFIVAAAGYTGLGVLGAILVALPVWVLATHHDRIPARLPRPADI